MRAHEHDRLPAIGMLVGRSAAMSEVGSLIHKAACARVPVLILGETGTGKELVARSIASLSALKIVPVNCAEFSTDLAESELFGHERGAFTNAIRTTPGLIGAANGKILFLDELAELSYRIQAKMLRVLDTGHYRRVGSTEVLASNFLTLAATNVDVDELVTTGRLRLDFLERLDGLRIVLPPLRARADDIPLLAAHFLSSYALQRRDAPRRISQSAARLLLRYAWPGNVRQLRNVIETSAALASPSSWLDAEHVERVLSRPSLRDRVPSAMTSQVWSEVPTLAQARRAAEQEVTKRALAQANGNRAAAAKLLGISQASLYRVLSKLTDNSQKRES